MGLATIASRKDKIMNNRQTKNLRDARLAAGMSQQALAAAVGVSQPTISMWERGEAEPSEIQRAQLRAVLSAGRIDWTRHADPTPPHERNNRAGKPRMAASKPRKAASVESDLDSIAVNLAAALTARELRQLASLLQGVSDQREQVRLRIVG